MSKFKRKLKSSRYVDKLPSIHTWDDLSRSSTVHFWPILHTCLRNKISIVAVSKTKTDKIAHDLREISYDTSANWTETLAKLPKPLANWSSVKRLLGETTGIPTVFSRAFDRFFNEMVVIIKENCNKWPNSVWFEYFSSFHWWPRVWSYVAGWLFSQINHLHKPCQKKRVDN